MNFPKSDSFPKAIMLERSMGPNPLKLCEELLDGAGIPAGSVVLDLGSGAGLTSALMAREYGFVVYAADLWSDPGDNMRFFEELGLTNRQVVPCKVDATAPPFVVDQPANSYPLRENAFLRSSLAAPQANVSSAIVPVPPFGWKRTV